MSGAVLFRVDASTAIGAGHWMRCLALAQALVDSGIEVTFASAECLPALASRCGREGIAVRQVRSAVGSPEDAQQTAALAATLAAGWIVVDGYRFDAGYHEALRAKSEGACLLALDDNGDREHHVADLVLNQNVHAGPELYVAAAEHVETLLGPAHALLRRELRLPRPPDRERGREVERILVTLGGGDPHDVTSRVVAALRDLPGRPALTVVIGERHPARARLEAAGRAGDAVRVVVEPPDMRPHLEAADLAIAAGGVTSLELASFGVPALLVVAADNQRGVVARLAALGAALSLGEASELSERTLRDSVAKVLGDPALRRGLSSRARALVDGRGVFRVLRSMQVEPLLVRRASVEDAALLFRWANDEGVRRAAFRQDEIAWDDHLAWLEAKLRNDRCRIYLVEDDGGYALAQVRFDEVSAASAEIDISVAPERRGGGLGARVLRAACARHRLERGPMRLVAEIKAWNRASRRAFAASGFTEVETVERGGEAVVRMSRTPLAEEIK